jgi:hypothetical protein
VGVLGKRALYVKFVTLEKMVNWDELTFSVMAFLLILYSGSGCALKCNYRSNELQNVPCCTFVDNSLAVNVSSLFCTATDKALHSSSLAPCFSNRSTMGTSRFRQASTKPVDCP